MTPWTKGSRPEKKYMYQENNLEMWLYLLSYYTVRHSYPMIVSRQFVVRLLIKLYIFIHTYKVTNLFVVWPTMTCFADWSKRRHVSFVIIEWWTRHGRPCVIIMINGHMAVYYYNEWHAVTWRSLNVNIRYILRCFCLRDIRLIVSIFY